MDGYLTSCPSCLVVHIAAYLFFLCPHCSLQQQLKQQDEGLDMLSKSAERLGALSMGISEELGQQNK